MLVRPKGTKDMLPAESYKWQAVEWIAERVAGMYNVKKIRTPVFCRKIPRRIGGAPCICPPAAARSDKAIRYKTALTAELLQGR